MRLADAINVLVPGAQHTGYLDDNSKKSYEKLLWVDKRPQPTWDEVSAVMAQPEPPSPKTFGQRLAELELATTEKVAALEARIAALETKGKPT
jgi:hypothetical protein